MYNYVNLLVLNFPGKAAGAAFCRAADLHLQLETKHEAATNLSDAGQVLKKEDPNGDHNTAMALPLSCCYWCHRFTYSNLERKLVWLHTCIPACLCVYLVRYGS